MPTDPTTTAALGLEPTYSAQEAAAMLGRSYSWLDQRLRAGQFVDPDGTPVTPLRTPGGYRRFTLQMLRDIVVASAHQGGFSVEDMRFALGAVITASYRETGKYDPYLKSSDTESSGTRDASGRPGVYHDRPSG